MKKNAFSTSSARPALARPIQDLDERERHRNIGRYLGEICNLTEEEVARILAHHQEHGVRFGDAAVALKLASEDDVVWALSQQFRYPYAFGENSVLDRELTVATDPFGESADSFRELRSQLLLGVLAEGPPRNTLAVLSVDEGDGRTYFAANMAIALSQTGSRTVLVDANMRSPRVHGLFDIRANNGLSSVLAGRSDLDSVAMPEFGIIHPVSELPGLYVLPAGTLPPNPLELLQRTELAVLICQLSGAFDHVIMDTPATSKAADGRVIAGQCAAAVILARRNTSAIGPLQKLLGSLSKTPTKIAGILINDY